MSFTYTNETFDGPLYLLLSLIESHKLSISTVSLASITAEYLQYVNQMSDFDPNSVSEFLSIAATLVLIKTKALLPNLEITESETSDIAELERRLQYFQFVQSGATHIQNCWQHAQPIYTRDNEWFDATTFLPGKKLDTVSMCTLANQLVQKLASRTREIASETIPVVSVAPVIKIEHVIEKINTLIKSGKAFRFSDTVSGKPGSREYTITTIVSFLALLELARSTAVILLQNAPYTEIECSQVN